MAFRTQKISQMTPKGSDLEATDLIEVSTIESGSYVTRSITGQELIDAIPVPPSGITIGTTAITSGTVGRVLFEGAGNVVQQSSSLFWDATNNRLGIGGTPSVKLQSYNSANGTSAGFGGTAYGIRIDNGGTFSVGRSTIYGVDNTFTASYQPLSIEASSLTLQSVTGGNVLIGTTTDAGFKLNVIGTGRFNGTVDIRGTNQNRIWLNTNAGSTTNGFLIGRSLSNDDAQNFFIYDNAAAASRLQIASTGNVLINTTTDAGFRLDVNGTARVSGNLTLRNVTDELLFANATVKVRRVSDKLSLEGFSGFDFIDTNTAFTRMQIRSTGNILINTTTDAGFRLDVNGTARVAPNGNTTAAVYFQTHGTYVNRGKLLIGGTDGANSDNGLRLAINTGSGKSFIDGWATFDIIIGSTGSSVQFGTDVGVPSAQVAINSTTKGFLPPRMTTTQKNAIASPAAGLMVYDTTLTRPCFYDGTTWITL